MTKDLVPVEVLKAVFPLLDGEDLVSCMLVCRQWRDITRDDYFWKCMCAKRWPSTCKRPPPTSYHKLFVTFCRSQPPQPLPPPKLSFHNLEFYIDLWSEETLLFSEAVSGIALQRGIKNPPPVIPDALKLHLESNDYKMIMQVEPKFSFSLGQTISVSVLVRRRDTNQLALIVNQALFGYVDGNSFKALAFDYLKFSPKHPFISGIRAWVSSLFMSNSCHNISDVFGMEIDFCDAANSEKEGISDVFGMEIDFCDAGNSEKEVLWLLDMLDWK